MTEASDITRLARRESLPDLLAFLEHACAAEGVDEETAFALRLAAEEACANVIQHGYASSDPGPIRLALDVTAHSVTLTIEDEAPPFDPADAPAPDLDTDWEERRIGGLGWHLIYQLMDEVRYRVSAPRGNHLTLIKQRTASA